MIPVWAASKLILFGVFVKMSEKVAKEWQGRTYYWDFGPPWAALGAKVRVCSCSDVTAWNRLTSKPTQRPANRSGAATMMMWVIMLFSISTL